VMINRRKFIASGSAAAAGLWLGSLDSFANDKVGMNT